MGQKETLLQFRIESSSVRGNVMSRLSILITNDSDTPKGLSYPPPSIEGGSASTSEVVDPPRRLSKNTLANIRAVVTREIEESTASGRSESKKT